ncbi:uncharacterized protein OCT59_009561 [Rhizophagus irregularis]|uniref:F-box domain-containing protein n=1 Tax=Rhizophagus irregularis (strain DAOM 181602 / DAOM 197198 / MUCL 43194) TaxID=747089 RepID=U9SYM7_RHIID|nr:hypothetical protein GLOIN_2v931996 [Rhizophagus irregularis DAOM 181602=DAOM 197198]POG75983.1 hypothetical protein GLOIN_2v931996 [Rhizophagus irregularis DAOM 181602=DAOM 197198]UZO18241.1 hypothetical protein OCT59_009561 [Rhizophagus irregularis]|eukprot:XP_025182849.1 hypothetical protein GLOIN_2v931996 [Rhizophagus irregularis DAOM 181602=DAOM 197198]
MSTYSHAKYLVITNIDILPIILSYVDKKSLLSSSLVSHYFNTVSTKILYSKVNLKNVKNVDSFLHTLDRTTHYNLYNTIHTNEYLVNNIHSITMDSPNLAYLSGEKLSKCISECRKLKEVIIGNCTLSQSIIISITLLENLNILKFKRCTIINNNLLNYLISGLCNDENFNMANIIKTITSTTTTTINTIPTQKNKLKNIIAKKVLHTRSSSSGSINSNTISSEITTIQNNDDSIYLSKLTKLTHLTIDIQPSCPQQLIILLIQQNKNLKSLDLLFQGLDESLLIITQISNNLEYLNITENKNLSEKTVFQLIKNCFFKSDSIDNDDDNNNNYCRLKKLTIDYGPFSEKFLFSLSNLCKTQRKISITQQPEEPETDYPGVDLVFTNDSLEILLDNCKNIGQILNTFYLNMDVDNSDIINPNRIEELILNRINISSDNLNLICENFDFKIFKLQNLLKRGNRLTKRIILDNIILLSNLEYLFVTDDDDDDDKNNLEQLNYNDFNELAQNCPNMVQIYWNHKQFIDKFKIPSKFIQVVDNNIWKNF